MADNQVAVVARPDLVLAVETTPKTLVAFSRALRQSFYDECNNPDFRAIQRGVVSLAEEYANCHIPDLLSVVDNSDKYFDNFTNLTAAEFADYLADVRQEARELRVECQKFVASQLDIVTRLKTEEDSAETTASKAASRANREEEELKKLTKEFSEQEKEAVKKRDEMASLEEKLRKLELEASTSKQAQREEEIRVQARIDELEQRRRYARDAADEKRAHADSFMWGLFKSTAREEAARDSEEAFRAELSRLKQGQAEAAVMASKMQHALETARSELEAMRRKMGATASEMNLATDKARQAGEASTRRQEAKWEAQVLHQTIKERLLPAIKDFLAGMKGFENFALHAEEALAELLYKDGQQGELTAKEERMQQSKIKQHHADMAAIAVDVKRGCKMFRRMAIEAKSDLLSYVSSGKARLERPGQPSSSQCACAYCSAGRATRATSQEFEESLRNLVSKATEAALDYYAAKDSVEQSLEELGLLLTQRTRPRPFASTTSEANSRGLEYNEPRGVDGYSYDTTHPLARDDRHQHRGTGHGRRGDGRRRDDDYYNKKHGNYYH